MRIYTRYSVEPFEEVLNERTEWTKSGPVLVGATMPEGLLELIRTVRMKGGAA